MIGNYISVKVKKETEEKDGEENKDNEREKHNFYLILEIKICRESLLTYVTPNNLQIQTMSNIS